MEDKKIALFQEKKVRREWHNDEWKKRGVKEGQEYSILTAEIASRYIGMALHRLNMLNSKIWKNRTSATT